jgi:hypothetical protein
MTDQSTQVSDREIWHTACRVLRDQGDTALLFATQRCSHLREAGDLFHLRIWQRVAAVLRNMSRDQTPASSAGAVPILRSTRDPANGPAPSVERSPRETPIP